jgi:FixJ family two-component response regulator
MTRTGSPQALVHIVDVDDQVRRLLTGWLALAGIDSRTYVHLGEFLNAHCPDVPGCLVIDAQPTAICGLESHAMLLPLAIRSPILVTACATAIPRSIATAKTDAIRFLAKPLCEREVVSAVSAALQADYQQRLIASRRDELRLRFATLSRREQQVMALVASGLLNKQVGCDLGVSEITVKAHRGAVMRKMHATSLADLVRMADSLGEELMGVFRSDSSSPTRSVVAADRRSDYSPDPRTRTRFRAAALCRAR